MTSTTKPLPRKISAGSLHPGDVFQHEAFPGLDITFVGVDVERDRHGWFRATVKADFEGRSQYPYLWLTQFGLVTLVKEVAR